MVRNFYREATVGPTSHMLEYSRRLGKLIAGIEVDTVRIVEVDSEGLYALSRRQMRYTHGELDEEMVPALGVSQQGTYLGAVASTIDFSSKPGALTLGELWYIPPAGPLVSVGADAFYPSYEVSIADDQFHRVANLLLRVMDQE